MLILFLLLTYSFIHGEKVIRIKQCFNVSRQIDDRYDEFRQWFSNPNTSTQIMLTYPYYDSIEMIDRNTFRNRFSLKITSGLELLQMIDLEVNMNSTTFSLWVKKNGVKQSYRGNRILKNLCSPLIPIIESKSTITLDKLKKTLHDEAEIELTFTLPTWLPIPENSLKNSAGKSVRIKFLEDMNNFMDHIIKCEKDWKQVSHHNRRLLPNWFQQNESSSSSSFIDHPFRAFQQWNKLSTNWYNLS